MTGVLMIIMAALAQSQTTAPDCTGAPPDSTWLAAGPVYRDCEVDTAARQKDEGPRYQNTRFVGLRVDKPCLRIKLDVVVEANGRVNRDLVNVVSSDHRVMTEETLKTLGGLRYDPAMKDGQAVRQLARYERSVRLEGVTIAVGPAGRPPPSQPPMRSC